MKRIKMKWLALCVTCFVFAISGVGSEAALGNTVKEAPDLVPVYYIDADTQETIYSETMRVEDIMKNNCFYEPPYLYQSNQGERYTLDVDHTDNCFETKYVNRAEYQPIYVHYKKGSPDQGKTAVKIRMLLSPSEEWRSNLIGIKYIDDLWVGSSYSCQPDPELGDVYVYQFDQFIYDEKNTANQLEISSLSENADENEITVYYTGRFFKHSRWINIYYYDAKTEELLKVSGEGIVVEDWKGAVVDALFRGKDGKRYVFDGADKRNVLNICDMEEKREYSVSAYYRQLINLQYEAGEGKCQTAAEVFKRDQMIADLPVPIREGYLFAGWFTQKTGGVQVKEGGTVDFDKDQTLFARWTKLASEDGESFEQADPDDRNTPLVQSIKISFHAGKGRCRNVPEKSDNRAAAASGEGRFFVYRMVYTKVGRKRGKSRRKG